MFFQYSIYDYLSTYNLLVVIILLSTVQSYAQLSPGKLSKGHAALEGLSNCTACHDLGAKISEKKCLDCHKPLKAQIQKNKGYHVSREIKGKDCITCHSEHHGLNFDMIRFDEKKFNHTLTGYELKGAHKKVDNCAKCHFDDHISDNNIKKNKNTFLGLDPKCITCHEDYHQKTLSADCAKCHDFEHFKPASAFNHSKTDFPLRGAHTTMDCAKCHKTEIRNGKKMQEFSGISFKNCTSCHKDPHKGEFGINCTACHNETSFRDVKSSSGFNHALTGFKLEGRHLSIDCKKCHDNRAGTKGNYKEFEYNNDITCLTCHNDVHESKFGTDCKSCHNHQSFTVNKTLPDFNHSVTGYALEGKHITVDCKKCHTKLKMTEPLPHERCASCHKDYHEGEFKDIRNRDCSVCHSVNGFNDGTFGLEQHQASVFSLAGAHIATPCTSCHMKENKWKFKDVGSYCIDCHQNIHIGIISDKFIGNNNCSQCHNNENWQSVTFNHKLTKFELKGKHAGIKCSSCHFQENSDKIIPEQKFEGISTECTSCHENIHGKQFEKSGVTDCKKCHGFEKWDRSNFNHNNAAFKLDGAHNNVACNKCHQEETIEGIRNIVYKTGKLACIDCHQ